MWNVYNIYAQFPVFYVRIAENVARPLEYEVNHPDLTVPLAYKDIIGHGVEVVPEVSALSCDGILSNFTATPKVRWLGGTTSYRLSFSDHSPPAVSCTQTGSPVFGGSPSQINVYNMPFAPGMSFYLRICGFDSGLSPTASLGKVIHITLPRFPEGQEAIPGSCIFH